MTRPRLLILTEDSKPSRGGIAEYLHQLASALATTHDVVIASSVAGAADVVAPPGVVYREVPWFRTQLRLPGDDRTTTRRLNTLRWRIDLRRAMRRRLLELLAGDAPTRVVIGRLSVVTHPWCLACRDLGVPYAVIGYGLEFLEPVTARQAAERRADILGADQWLPISHDTARLIAEYGVPMERMTLVPPAVEAGRVQPPPQTRRSVRARFGLGDSPFVLTLGFLRRRKGMDLAIDAIVRLVPTHPEVMLVIAGDGPEAQSLRVRAEASGVGDRIRFAGAVDDDTRNALLAECAVFVLANRRLPNDVEGFGIVFLEAGLHGKPVVGGRNGGVVDAVADGATGLLVDTAVGPEPLAAAIGRLLDDPSLAIAMGSRGRERARTQFAWTERAATVAAILERVGAATPR